MYATVHFALPGGGEHYQRVAWSGHDGSTACVPKLIARAAQTARARGITVANVVRVMHRHVLIFDYVSDTARRFR